MRFQTASLEEADVIWGVKSSISSPSMDSFNSTYSKSIISINYNYTMQPCAATTNEQSGGYWCTPSHMTPSSICSAINKPRTVPDLPWGQTVRYAYIHVFPQYFKISITMHLIWAPEHVSLIWNKGHSMFVKLSLILSTGGWGLCVQTNIKTRLLNWK